VPGSSNVAFTTILPSAGISGGVQLGAHGEFMFARVSSHGAVDSSCAGACKLYGCKLTYSAGAVD